MERRRGAAVLPGLHAAVVQPAARRARTDDGVGALNIGAIGSGRLDVTGTHQHESWAAGVLPDVEQVGRSVWSVPVPIPDNPLRYVSCYVLESRDGPVLVDPGWPADASWQALQDGLRRAGHDVADVVGVLISHAHSDHHGLASRVRDVSGCWVGMHPADAALLAAWRDGSEVSLREESWPDVCGVPLPERSALRMDSGFLRRSVALEPDVLLESGSVGLVRGLRLEARWTPGHTPGHLCFRLPDEQLLLTGDHVLPRITSHIGGYELDETGASGSDVLGTYFDSLDDVAAWVADEDPEVLPGHEYRFRGVAARVAAVRAHHDLRLSEVAEIVSGLGTATVWEVAQGLTWSRGWSETVGARRRLAVSEALAHLVHAERRGTLRRLAGTPGRWRLAGPTTHPGG